MLPIELSTQLLLIKKLPSHSIMQAILETCKFQNLHFKPNLSKKSFAISRSEAQIKQKDISKYKKRLYVERAKSYKLYTWDVSEERTLTW